MQSSSDPVICLCCHGDSIYSGHSGGQVRLWSTSSSSSSSLQKYVSIVAIHKYSKTKKLNFVRFPYYGYRFGSTSEGQLRHLGIMWSC